MLDGLLLSEKELRKAVIDAQCFAKGLLPNNACVAATSGEVLGSFQAPSAWCYKQSRIRMFVE